MKTTSMARKRTATSLSGQGNRTTLRLQALMEHQQKIEIGQRLKTLREASPQTNASIADYVGVGERSVANWMSGGTGIQWEHARKVAELFEVDVNWLWTGSEHFKGPTPDPFSQTPTEDAGQSEVDAIRRHSEVMTELAQIRTLLEAQGKTGQRAARKKASG